MLFIRCFLSSSFLYSFRTLNSSPFNWEISNYLSVAILNYSFCMNVNWFSNSFLYSWSPVVSSISISSWSCSICFWASSAALRASSSAFFASSSFCFLLNLGDPLGDGWPPFLLEFISLLFIEIFDIIMVDCMPPVLLILFSLIGRIAVVLQVGSSTARSYSVWACLALSSVFRSKAAWKSSRISWDIYLNSQIFLYVNCSTTGSVGIDTVWFTISKH